MSANRPFPSLWQDLQGQGLVINAISCTPSYCKLTSCLVVSSPADDDAASDLGEGWAWCTSESPVMHTVLIALALLDAGSHGRLSTWCWHTAAGCCCASTRRAACSVPWLTFRRSSIAYVILSIVVSAVVLCNWVVPHGCPSAARLHGNKQLVWFAGICGPSAAFSGEGRARSE